MRKGCVSRAPLVSQGPLTLVLDDPACFDWSDGGEPSDFLEATNIRVLFVVGQFERVGGTRSGSAFSTWEAGRPSGAFISDANTPRASSPNRRIPISAIRGD